MKSKIFILFVLSLFPVVSANTQNYDTVSTFAGTGSVGLGNSTLLSSTFNHPYGICSDSSGAIYVADALNHCIRKMQGGNVTTVAGNGISGDVDANGTSARLNSPTGVYFKNGYLYICDNLNNKIKRMDASGNVITIAGSGAWTHQDGPVSSAAFKEPKSLVVDNNNVVYVADYENHCIRKIANGQVTTIAGAGGVSGDQTGLAANARFYRPRDLCIDAQGNIYIVDLMNNKVKVLTTGGNVNLVAGSGSQGGNDGVGANASFDRPVGIDWFPTGELCVLDAVSAKIRMVTVGGVVTTIAGTGSSGYTNGPSLNATFNLPQDICFDPTGNLYVGDDNNNVIRILQGAFTNPKGFTEYTVHQLSVFPNPSTSSIIIQNPTTQNEKLNFVQIFTLDGKVAKTISITSQEPEIRIDISDLAAGSYILHAVSDVHRVYTAKIIRE
jgi:sugar lactone lactonase YvrE